MNRTRGDPQAKWHGISKSPTGVKGLDEITTGGLAAGRPILLCGNAGCGKTPMEFLVRGATRFNEAGVFLAFEETAELGANFSLHRFDLAHLTSGRSLQIDDVHVERSEIEKTGDYDRDGLFVRLAHSIAFIGAKRVVQGTLRVAVRVVAQQMILRAQLRRLFRWLNAHGVTAVFTADRGDRTLTWQGL
jgi:circadian clock protein KaiC